MSSRANRRSSTSNCTYSGGRSRNTIGLPCGPTGIDERGRPCKEDLKIPRTHEFTAGVEREMVPGVAIALDGIYRKFTNQYDTTETNRRWNTSGTGLERIGSFRNGRSQTVSNLGTPDSPETALHGRRPWRCASARAAAGRRLATRSVDLEGATGDYGNNPGQDIYPVRLPGR